jgi:hypothetical protein
VTVTVPDLSFSALAENITAAARAATCDLADAETLRTAARILDAEATAHLAKTRAECAEVPATPGEAFTRAKRVVEAEALQEIVSEACELVGNGDLDTNAALYGAAVRRSRSALHEVLRRQLARAIRALPEGDDRLRAEIRDLVELFGVAAVLEITDELVNGAAGMPDPVVVQPV